MRILVISDAYPPYYHGGYEVGCYNAVNGLKARRHEVKVLTSTYGVGRPECGGEVYRWLKSNIVWHDEWKTTGLIQYIIGQIKKEIINQNAFKRLCRIYKPDVIYVWSLTNISVSTVYIAQMLGIPVCYYVFDNWQLRWDKDSWYSMWNRKSRDPIRGLVKKLLQVPLNLTNLRPKKPYLDSRNVQFASYYLKQFALDSGKPVTDAKVIYWGIGIYRFPYKVTSCNPKRLLYVGQIVSHKGVDTAIEALNILVRQNGYKSLKLTIVGGTTTPTYERYVKDLVVSLDLENNVSFAGFIPNEDLPRIYQAHDILIFPTLWDEPFGIVLLEAMSSGLAIVGTANGGSREILEDGINALVFPSGDVQACASQIIRLLQDSKLYEKIRHNGRRTVEERFNFASTIGKIEESLCEAIACSETAAKY